MLLCIFFLPFSLSESLPECSPGTVDTNCEIRNFVGTRSDPLTTYFQEYTISANISFTGCTFKNFTSQVNDNAGIISISNEQQSTYFAFFENCNFENNRISSPILMISKAFVNFDNLLFSENTITRGSMIRLVGQTYLMTACRFIKNNVNQKISYQDSLSSSSLISISENGLIQIQNCCFLTDSASSPVFDADDNSRIKISKNTVFNCPISQIISSHNIKSTSFLKFDKTTSFSSDKCVLHNEPNDPSDPPDDSDDKEKKISKYLYIGIGAAAGAIVIGIIIFLICRIAGKCKKLEEKTDEEGIELAEKRTAYLLQDGEQGEEIIPKEENNNKLQEDDPKEEDIKNEEL